MYMWQVGAIILYTYVFHMLAPPPGGSFDDGEENLPIKTTSVNGGAPEEHIPLLTFQDPEQRTEKISTVREQVRRKCSFCSPENCICHGLLFSLVQTQTLHFNS